jgi:hypothetical protein
MHFFREFTVFSLEHAWLTLDPLNRPAEWLLNCVRIVVTVAQAQDATHVRGQYFCADGTLADSSCNERTAG